MVLDGPGIPPEFHVLIFELYSRLHWTSLPGNGLGLAICQEMVETHRGRFWLKSDPGAGVNFLLNTAGSELAAPQLERFRAILCFRITACKVVLGIPR